MEDSLATELLREIKRESKRRFILLVVCISLLFASNMAWLIAWNLPSERATTEESYELQGEDNANVVYNTQGEVSINGENKGNEEDDSSTQNEQTEKP